jgi:molybdopterin/thiamine biosynthesis adenylyltransferase
MSQQLISRNATLKQLRDEGYEVEVWPQPPHLLVHSVPYVNSRREIARGTLVSTLKLAGDVTQPPDTHMVHFVGQHPCNVDGTEIAQIKNASRKHDVAPKLSVDHTFSSKPLGGACANYHEKMATYATIISSPAQAIDSTVTAKTFAPIAASEQESVFVYLDTASSRAGIGALTSKFDGQRIAIIGGGGTGAYALDQVAKTPVPEIHLFDGDRFYSHNAFRSPGAATLDQLRGTPFKVDYLRSIYSAMHRGITAHPYNITSTNVAELLRMTFVFICIDDGPAKKVIVEVLESAGISFIDTGIGVELVDGRLMGQIRVTTSTPDERDHFRTMVSFADAQSDDIYRNNIQIAELNALAATLAIMKWKKLLGFYMDLDREHNSVYTISGNTLNNDTKK